MVHGRPALSDRRTTYGSETVYRGRTFTCLRSGASGG